MKAKPSRLAKLWVIEVLDERKNAWVSTAAASLTRAGAERELTDREMGAGYRVRKYVLEEP